MVAGKDANGNTRGPGRYGDMDGTLVGREGGQWKYERDREVWGHEWDISGQRGRSMRI